jgi:hypothetical protein
VSVTFDLMSNPIFSVIIPLEFHRGQWERCWLGWQAQTVSKTQYEIILIVPSDFPERDKLAALLRPRDRLIYSNERHDVALSAIGAARAHGQFLFLAGAGRSGKMPASICDTS